MIRRPPRSTLFPYTNALPISERLPLRQCTTISTELSSSFTRRVSSRSEEHTSELQSHLNLVCRLLLEKKKITTGRLRLASHPLKTLILTVNRTSASPTVVKVF